MDLTNPSPSLVWSNEERLSLLERGPADTALALALIHHLAIANNIPMAGLARFLGLLCEFLIIEFVPKSDSQVKRMLATRKDIFRDYHKDEFEEQFWPPLFYSGIDPDSGQPAHSLSHEGENAGIAPEISVSAEAAEKTGPPFRIFRRRESDRGKSTQPGWS